MELSKGRIDTHAHMILPEFLAYMREQGIEGAGGRPFPEWSPESALAFMDERSVASAIWSISAPGVYFGDAAKARRAARTVNEAAAELAKDRPDRFGFFATLTLPDVEGSIDEARYALDVLKADGVILLANSAGRYLGDESFDPLLAELDRHGAVIFVHPTELPGPDVPGIPTFAADFLLDTTRAAISLARSGALTRYPNLKIILSHAGGFVPFAAYRMAGVCVPALMGTPQGFIEGLALLKRFYFDVALSGSPSALPSLLAFAEPDHITFGTDWCWVPAAGAAVFTNMYEGYSLSDDQRHSIDRGAAEKLFPRFLGKAIHASV